jgi:hypothetical protein
MQWHPHTVAATLLFIAPSRASPVTLCERHCAPAACHAAGRVRRLRRCAFACDGSRPPACRRAVLLSVRGYGRAHSCFYSPRPSLARPTRSLHFALVLSLSGLAGSRGSRRDRGALQNMKCDGWLNFESLAGLELKPRPGCLTRRARRRPGAHSSNCFRRRFSRRGEHSGDRAWPGWPRPRPGRK